MSASPALTGGFARIRQVPRPLIWLLLLVLGLLLPFVVYPVLAMEMLCFALFASAFNLLLGFAGLLSFGHAAFFGLGAYLLTSFIIIKANVSVK